MACASLFLKVVFLLVGVTIFSFALSLSGSFGRRLPAVAAVREDSTVPSTAYPIPHVIESTSGTPAQPPVNDNGAASLRLNLTQDTVALQRFEDFFIQFCPGVHTVPDSGRFLCPPVDARVAIRDSYLRGLENYIRLHRQMVDNSTVRERHFLVVTNPLSHGMGNRFHTIISGLLLAMVSGRALLLDWPAVDAKDAQMHFNNEEKMAMARLEELLEVPPGLLVWETARARERFPELFADPRKFVVIRDSEVECLFLDPSGFNGSSVLTITSWDYFAPSVARNPHYAERVQHIIGDALEDKDTHMFAGLGRYLFRPSKSIALKVDSFLRASSRPIVGAHLRLIGMNKIPLAQVAPFWNCVSHAVASSAKARSVSVNSPTVFFAADSVLGWETSPSALCGRCEQNGDASAPVVCGRDCDVHARPHGNQELQNHSNNADRVMIVAQQPISQVRINNEVAPARDSPQSVVEGVTDFFLIAVADEVVGSFKSTFSRAAAALADIPPLIFAPSGKCIRRSEAQACQYVPTSGKNCKILPLRPAWQAQVISCWDK